MTKLKSLMREHNWNRLIARRELHRIRRLENNSCGKVYLDNVFIGYLAKSKNKSSKFPIFAADLPEINLQNLTICLGEQ